MLQMDRLAYGDTRISPSASYSVSPMNMGRNILKHRTPPGTSFKSIIISTASEPRKKRYDERRTSRRSSLPAISICVIGCTTPDPFWMRWSHEKLVPETEIELMRPGQAAILDVCWRSKTDSLSFSIYLGIWFPRPWLTCNRAGKIKPKILSLGGLYWDSEVSEIGRC